MYIVFSGQYGLLNNLFNSKLTPCYLENFTLASQCFFLTKLLKSPSGLSSVTVMLPSARPGWKILFKYPHEKAGSNFTQFSMSRLSIEFYIRLPTTYCLLITAYRKVLTADYLPHVAHCLLQVEHCLPHVAHC